MCVSSQVWSSVLPTCSLIKDTKQILFLCIDYCISSGSRYSLSRSFTQGFLSDLTEPSGPQGTCRVMGMGMALSARKVSIALCASASLRGALTQVQPRYDSLLNWTLSSSRTVGLHGPGHASVNRRRGERGEI